MLIPKIVSEIDAQLEKLTAARQQIATLYGVQNTGAKRGRKPMAAKLSAAAEATDTPKRTLSTEAAVTGRVASKEPRERRAAKRSKAVESGALASSVPTGAVFVSSSEVARRAEAKAAAVAIKPEAAAAVESGFDALVREAAARSRAVIQ